MQKHVNLVDLVRSFPTNIYLQNLASIQKRTSPLKFAHLAEKSGKGSISNLSTKVFVTPKSEKTKKKKKRTDASPSPTARVGEGESLEKGWSGIALGESLEREPEEGPHQTHEPAKREIEKGKTVAESGRQAERSC